MSESLTPEFIEVKRVLSNGNEKGVNTHSVNESLLVSKIEGFRPWHKGKNDELIKGEMTMVILKPEEATQNKKKILIEESYKNFKDRLGARVVIR